MHRPRLSVGLLVALALPGCEQAAEPPPSPEEVSAPAVRDPAVELVDTGIPPAVAGEAGWELAQAATADLDGDGVEERAVLTARVEMYRGRPAWDDGQPWQVYVEEGDGTRTYAYARFVQLGTVEALLTRGDGGPPTLVLVERVPDALTVYEVAYRGPGRVETIRRLHRTLDPVHGFAGPPVR